MYLLQLATLLTVIGLTSCKFKVTNRTLMQKYCKYNRDNTPCRSCDVGPDCGPDPPHVTIMQKYVIRWILQRHNEYRNEVAAIPGLQPAANMNILSWDQEAEFLAICHVIQCKNEHDPVRLNQYGQPMGQNMYHIKVDEEGGTMGDWTNKAIYSWIQEAESKALTGIVKNYTHNKEYENFSQAIWAKTKYVGCAYYSRSNVSARSFEHFIFCNYLVKGNVEGESIYEVGRPKCRTARRFKFLCGQRRRMHGDSYKFPVEFPLVKSLGGRENFAEKGFAVFEFWTVCGLCFGLHVVVWF